MVPMVPSQGYYGHHNVFLKNFQLRNFRMFIISQRYFVELVASNPWRSQLNKIKILQQFIIKCFFKL